ncbi:MULTISPECIES: PrsW family glutamic-type intramembrane protease [unclassified Lentimicrobium]|uniref:PrsW family glutamic-type intramembrane protease n=1 Tax=unclassified Lentimicrobium TaxID=2677434 RepID=UPI0015532998|nr:MULTISPECIES: PrsW family glutamic-type intramembrane protease [unclassified Lentimicrobium]NPD44237.1 PrsW family intramembrane metalloprotease [Lentimicrobium sp. S6]NPD85775.1 PrsW family intramembrane metalloprotease [Lentimicrobium sp. L6]
MLQIVLSLILGPLMAAILFGYMKYRFPRGYFGLLLRSYFWGIFSTIVFATIFYITYQQGYLVLKNLRRIIFFSFFIIAFGQEIGKFIVLRYLMLPAKVFRNPSDSIIYSLMISFGAVTATNIGILLFFPNYDYSLLISNVLVGMVYAVLMGFFVGMGKIRNNRMIDSLSGLFGAILFHGIYEFIIQTNDQLLIWPFLIGSGIITFLLIVKSIQISDEL